MDSSWIDHFYVLPEWVGRGIGTRLLERARSTLPPPLRLYTFQCNERARYFYERRGFQAIAFGGGSGNEEKCPDILYEWRPRRDAVPNKPLQPTRAMQPNGQRGSAGSGPRG